MEINNMQFGDIAQLREDKLKAFAIDLEQVLKKHNINIDTNECMWAVDSDTNQCIGEIQSLTPNDALFGVYINDIKEN